MKLSAVVLDVDGTLYRQRPVRMKMLAALAARTLVRPLEMVSVWRVLSAYRHAQEAMRGRSDWTDIAREQIRLACEAAGAGEATATCHVTEWMERAPLNLLSAAMRPGVVEFLRAMKQRGVRLAVWSDYPASRKLDAMGIASYFDVVLCAQDPCVQRFKPDPRGLEELLSRLSVPKQEVLYVGDRADVDGVAAERAGVRCVLIGSGVRDFHELLQSVAG